MIKVWITLLLSIFVQTAVIADENIFYYQSNDGELFFSDEVQHQGFSRYGKAKPSTRSLEQLIEYYAAYYRIEPHLIRAIIKTESNFNPRAVSAKGAQGLMQIMPATASMLNLHNPFDAEANIRAGSLYISQLMKQFRGNLEMALAAYNAGPTTVQKYGSIPPYPETSQYVKQVLLYYHQYKTLS